MKLILDLGVLAVTLLLMMTVGMALEPRHFQDLVRRKGTLVLTLAGQIVLLPVIGVAVTRGLGLPPHLVAGILLLAACPVGDIVNFYTLLARGNLPLSVTVNALSCLLSAVTMATVFAVYQKLLGGAFVFAVPAPALIARLMLMIVLPLLTGMIVRRFQPSFVERHGAALRGVCVAGIAFLLAYVLLTRREQLATEWQQTAIAGAVFILLALAAGLGFARLLRLATADALTVGMIFAVRNVALASAIAITLLNRVDYAVFAAVYFLVEVPLLLGTVAIYRRCWKWR